jgi:hypothetical protein
VQTAFILRMEDASGHAAEQEAESIAFDYCLMFGLLVMGPHPKHLDDTLPFDDLIDKTVLYIDAARICAAQISDEFLERPWPAKQIGGEDQEELLSL